jgi:ketosteroid isomerase-like protein
MSMDTLIADRIEIADLFTRFARLLDEKRWEDADTVFTDDVEVHSPRIQVRGTDKVVDYMRQAEVEGEHTQHITTDLLVSVNGDHAVASGNSLVYFYRDDQPPPPNKRSATGLRRSADASGLATSRDPDHARLDKQGDGEEDRGGHAPGVGAPGKLSSRIRTHALTTGVSAPTAGVLDWLERRIAEHPG